MTWRGVWLRAQITGLMFSSMIWLVVAGLSLPAAAAAFAAGVVWLLARDTRAGLWWRFGARRASPFERERVLAAIVPISSLRGRHQPRIWVGTRTGTARAVVPTTSDLVVSTVLVRRIVGGELDDVRVSALVSHALGQRPVWGSRLVAVMDVYCLPWRLVEMVTVVFGVTAGGSRLMGASWRIRWLVFGVAVVDNVQAARWHALVVVVIVAVLSGTTPVFRRRWHAALRDLGDRQVIVDELGPVLASVIRAATPGMAGLERGHRLDGPHGPAGDPVPAGRKRACR